MGGLQHLHGLAIYLDRAALDITTGAALRHRRRGSQDKIESPNAQERGSWRRRRIEAGDLNQAGGRRRGGELRGDRRCGRERVETRRHDYALILKLSSSSTFLPNVFLHERNRRPAS
jgi:hypothetical protein